MDFDAKNREKLSLYDLSLFFPRNDESFLEESLSSKPTISSTLHLQDDDLHLHQSLEKFNLNLNGSSSSSTPLFSMQPTCLDENPSFGCFPSFDFYETKPFFETHVGNYMDNFNQSGVLGLGHSQMVMNPINLISHQNHSHFSYGELDFTIYAPPDDQGSSSSPKNDSAIITHYSSSSAMMPKKEGRGQKKKIINVIKGQWTIEEDRLLIKLVERFGVRKWSHIAQLLNGRIGKQCRERWHNHLKPDIKKDLWSEDEDRILIKAHQEIGNKWAEIAKRLPGRTENSIKNHWNATKRRQFSKRKCRSKYPRQSSLLQEYIKSLDPETINAGCRKKPSQPKSSNHQTGSSDSSSSTDHRPGHDYEFSEVPDFNFDAQMLEESSIDSLLEGAPYDHDDHHQGYGVKRELDLVEMINQVNL